MSSGRGRMGLFFILIILLALGMGFLSYSIFWSGKIENREANSISNIIGKVLIAQKSGKNVELDSRDINGILSGAVKDGIKKGSISINSIYSSIENSEIKIYSTLGFKQLDFLLSSVGKLGYENDAIVFTPSAFYLGKLPLPKGIVLSNLSKYNNDSIRVNNSKIEIGKSIMPFSIKSIEVKDRIVLVGIGKSLDLSGNGRTSGGGTLTGGLQNTKLLKEALDQLDRVYEAVKTNREKDIVGSIGDAINKIIENPKYSYSKDVKKIKDRYNSLSIDEKLDLTKSIAGNMSSEVIGFIKGVFGI